MQVLAFFTNSGVPATGLSPTVRIRDISDNSLLVTDAAASEIGDGWYKYNFTTYDSREEYAIRFDGGATLENTDRYTSGTNDSFIDDIVNGVWDSELADHTIPGTYGYELATKADINASINIDSTTAINGVVVYGTENSGTYHSTFIRDGIEWNITEDAATGITAELTFNIPTDNKAGMFRTFGRYEGTPGGTHYIDLWVYNYIALAWEQLKEEFMPGGITGDGEYEYEYFERNIDRNNNNEVKFRLIHNVTTYNASHNMYLDFVEVTSIEVTASLTAEEIADAVLDEQVTDHLTVGSLGYVINEINNDLKRVLGLMHENIFIDEPVYDEGNNLVSARVRIYSDSISVGTNNDVIGTYEITADTNDEPGKFNNWSQVKI